MFFSFVVLFFFSFDQQTFLILVEWFLKQTQKLVAAIPRQYYSSHLHCVMQDRLHYCRFFRHNFYTEEHLKPGFSVATSYRAFARQVLDTGSLPIAEFNGKSSTRVAGQWQMLVAVKIDRSTYFWEIAEKHWMAGHQGVFLCNYFGRIVQWENSYRQIPGC